MTLAMAFDPKELERFRAGAEVESEAEKALPDPVRPVSNGRRILSFDQSLSNTGWAYIEQGRVVETGNIRTEKEDKGHEDNLNRGVAVYIEVEGLFERFEMGRDTLVVHETPPVGGRMMRPEASLVAATAIRIAAYRRWVPVAMVGAQRAKKRWTGNGNAKKGAVKEAVLRLHPYLKDLAPMNEAVIDAIAIGLLAAEGHVIERTGI